MDLFKSVGGWVGGWACIFKYLIFKAWLLIFLVASKFTIPNVEELATERCCLTLQSYYPSYLPLWLTSLTCRSDLPLWLTVTNLSDLPLWRTSLTYCSDLPLWLTLWLAPLTYPPDLPPWLTPLTCLTYRSDLPPWLTPLTYPSYLSDLPLWLTTLIYRSGLPLWLAPLTYPPDLPFLTYPSVRDHAGGKTSLTSRW